MPLKPKSAYGPDFIGVGPEKTGTSWIDTQLREHPDISLPPVKELRYFWEKNAFPGEIFWHRINVKKSWHREQYMMYVIKRLKSLIRNSMRNIFFDRNRLAWDINYVLRSHDDRWYLSCFEGSPDKVNGEISPQYFFCPASHIKAVHDLLPNCKIIVTLRRPIDWVWSFAKMNMKNGIIESYYKTLDRYIDSKIANCSYSGSLGHWKKFYPEDRLLVLLYDNLVEDPWKYYSAICSFLEIIPDEKRRAKAAEKVNSGSQEWLPDRLAAKIRNGWKNDVQALSTMVPDLPDSWID